MAVSNNTSAAALLHNTRPLLRTVSEEQPTLFRCRFITSAHIRRNPCYIYAEQVEDGRAVLSRQQGDVTRRYRDSSMLFVIVDTKVRPFQTPEILLSACERETTTEDNTGQYAAAPRIAKDVSYAMVNTIKMSNMEDVERMQSHFHRSSECRQLSELFRSNDPNFVARILPAFVDSLPLLVSSTRFEERAYDELAMKLVSSYIASCFYSVIDAVKYHREYEPSVARREVELEEETKAVERDIEMWEARQQLQAELDHRYDLEAEALRRGGSDARSGSQRSLASWTPSMAKKATAAMEERGGALW